ncbi:MAG: hypothetical protein K0R59_3239 [Sphingobacterium sp.]|uniref:hypothetical protein n=1 Tax=Sphingobacterium sp. NGMCC 1.201703 TaxID=3388657 RepID=UPI002A6928BA|nr:hypothetical protein [Sphingobacterium sp.]
MIRRFSIIIAVSLFSASFSFAQDLGGLFNKVKQGAKSLSKSLSWEPGKAVSTALKDTLNGFYWMNDVLEARTADTITTFSLTPGYYRTTLRSYCLHAGTYGPSKGAGYQLANFEGAQKKLIVSILEKSVEHSEITQSDVQTLIWGIEAGTKFSSYPTDFQLRVKPLLSIKDIALLEINVKDMVESNLPPEVKSLMNTYASLRQEMQSTQMSFDKLEDIAVKTGASPLGVGSISIDEGKWSYLNSGYFIRVDPQSYSTSAVSLYRPVHAEVSYDAQNRISSYANDGYQVKVNYKDTGKPIQLGDYTGKVQQIESYTVAGPGKEATTYPWDGKYVDLGMDFVHDILKGAKEFNLDQMIKDKSNLSLDELQNAYKDVEKWKSRYDDLKKINEDFNLDKNPPSDLDKYINEAAINERINKGLEVALNPIDKKGQSEWLKNHFKMVGDFFFYSICKLRGDDCKPDNDPKKPKLPDYIAQPGNTSSQRLGLSEYKK